MKYYHYVLYLSACGTLDAISSLVAGFDVNLGSKLNVKQREKQDAIKRHVLYNNTCIDARYLNDLRSLNGKEQNEYLDRWFRYAEEVIEGEMQMGAQERRRNSQLYSFFSIQHLKSSVKKIR